MDLIVQKATELGVKEILPFESARTVVKARGERGKHKKERWDKIAIEASKQCGRVELPKIKETVYFDTILDSIPKYNLTVMPCFSKKAVFLKGALKNKAKKLFVIIGPEGGFTDDEIRRAEEKGAVSVSLGSLVLRSETAAIATISILNYELQ